MGRQDCTKVVVRVQVDLGYFRNAAKMDCSIANRLQMTNNRYSSSIIPLHFLLPGFRIVPGLSRLYQDVRIQYKLCWLRMSEGVALCRVSFAHPSYALQLCLQVIWLNCCFCRQYCVCKSFVQSMLLQCMELSWNQEDWISITGILLEFARLKTGCKSVAIHNLVLLSLRCFFCLDLVLCRIVMGCVKR